MTASKWIKVCPSLSLRPEVIEISAVMGVDVDSVVGKLIRVWSIIASSPSPFRNVERVRIFFDELAGHNNFYCLCMAYGMLDSKDGNICVPRFEQEGGMVIYGGKIKGVR